MSLSTDTQDHAGPSKPTARLSRIGEPRGVSKPKPKPEPIPYRPGLDPESDEQAAVHEVYERIAPHFSQTRHKPWPLISSFLHSLPPNSIGLDSGGGNGKYVPVAREAGLSMIVMDRSLGLLRDARKQPGFGARLRSAEGDEAVPKRADGEAEGEGSDGNGYVGSLKEGGGDGECVRGDLTSEGWRRGVFDFAISIAAIHHLSTPDRRRRSVQALIYPLVHSSQPPYSRFLIYVWAYEQSDKSKRKMGATAAPTDEPAIQTGSMSSEKGDGPAEQEGKKGRVQDVLVPWVLQNRTKGKIKPKAVVPPGRPSDPITAESNSVAESVPVSAAQAGLSSTEMATEKEEPETQVFHRYYHLFVRGELRELVEEAVMEEGYIVRDGQDPDITGISDGTEDIRRGIEELETEGPKRKKWFRVVKEGWEADNWWLEGEVGLC